jgi:hypothetical protein
VRVCRGEGTVGLDSSRTYKLRLPDPIPAKDFWSVVVYDLWTRSMLANGRAFPSLNSHTPGIAKGADGSVWICIGPKAHASRTISGTLLHNLIASVPWLTAWSTTFVGWAIRSPSTHVEVSRSFRCDAAVPLAAAQPGRSRDRIEQKGNSPFNRSTVGFPLGGCLGTGTVRGRKALDGHPGAGVRAQAPGVVRGVPPTPEPGRLQSRRRGGANAASHGCRPRVAQKTDCARPRVGGRGFTKNRREHVHS